MIKTREKIFIVLIAAVLLIVFFNIAKHKKGSGGEVVKELSPVRGDIRLTVATTGIVQPQNRLQIKPCINGRIEKILVKEGDRVKKGDILLLMSSTERVALVDAARLQGEVSSQYWEEVYKQTPLISPIEGEVIVRSIEPGQTVATSDAVLVLSGRLIVKAQFDETDVGKIKLGQRTEITLDAYPKVKIDGVVDHIAYESELVSNVNIYDVDIVLSEIPEILRSGMSTNVEVVEKEKKDVIIIPVTALISDKGRTFVMVKKSSRGKVIEQDVETGLSDDKNIEIISGLTTDDTVIVANKLFTFKENNSGKNPFLPSHR